MTERGKCLFLQTPTALLQYSGLFNTTLLGPKAFYLFFRNLFANFQLSILPEHNVDSRHLLIVTLQ
jgi:hypothetical protein